MSESGVLRSALRQSYPASLYAEGWPGRTTGRSILQQDPRARIAHLLRRAGFGADQSTLDEYEALGIGGAVDRLLNYEAQDDPAGQVAPPQFPLGAKVPVAPAVAQMQQWWLQRMATTRRPLLEKMVLFWHGHLTSGVSKVREPELLLRQNEFFRQNATGAFDAILKGISRDAAMMVWLDNFSNRKQHPNENYARELMELFTLGIGNYSEQDVTEVARAFTGWTVDRQTGDFLVQKNQHDAGQKTILGETGSFDGDGVVDILVRHPAAGPFIAGKLFTFFVYPNPEPEVLRPISDAYYQSGFSIKEVLRAILTSDAFFSDKAYRAKIKSPTEYVVGIVRHLGLQSDFSGMPARLARMGQVLFDPPNVAGWPGGPVWINTATWIERMNFLNLLSIVGPQDVPGLASFLALVNGQPAEAAVDVLVSLLLDGEISEGARQRLLAHAGGRLTPAGARDLVYLVLGTPEYQLA